MKVLPPITWPGNKARYTKQIVPEFPEHTTFVDVFGGSAAVILAKAPSRVDVYNDIDSRLVNFFRVLRDPVKAAALIKLLKYTPYSREEFYNLAYGEDEIENARLFFIQCRQSFAGIGDNWSYSIDNSIMGMSSSVRRFHAGIERLEDITERLSTIQIECLDWRKAIEVYDRPETLFYLDPPYIGESRTKKLYQNEILTNAEHTEIVSALLNIKGKAVLSGYDNDVYTSLEAHGWHKVNISTVDYIGKGRNARVEVLWISQGERK